ncbi:Min8 protein [Maudiozyma humilis]|uniref:Min8 protein n=1 Tax=Maudiozyma humilis TaxID=51915 RepID=A0AAV5RTW3_MAUHU|nr:Min8 protein [Kazachstania humilis]
MIPTRALMNAAKQSSGTKIPVELTPLVLAVCVALSSGCFFTYKKLTTDDTLRLTENSNQSALKDALAKEQ